MNQRLLPRWFSVWFYLSCLVLSLGGLANRLAGKKPEGLDPLGAGISVGIMYVFLIFIWRRKEALRAVVSKIPFPLAARSVLVGWFFSQIDEAASFPFNPLYPGITLIRDLIFTTPPYIGAQLCWFYVLKRYKFTEFEALLTGGFSLGLWEVFSGGGNLVGLFLSMAIFPFVVMIHGIHMIAPKLALDEDFKSFEQRDNRWKYFIGVVFPFLGTALGVAATYLLFQISCFSLGG